MQLSPLLSIFDQHRLLGDLHDTCNCFLVVELIEDGPIGQ